MTRGYRMSLSSEEAYMALLSPEEEIALGTSHVSVSLEEEGVQGTSLIWRHFSPLRRKLYIAYHVLWVKSCRSYLTLLCPLRKKLTQHLPHSEEEAWKAPHSLLPWRSCTGQLCPLRRMFTQHHVSSEGAAILSTPCVLRKEVNRAPHIFSLWGRSHSSSLRKKLYGKTLSCKKEAYIAPVIAVRRKMLTLLRDEEWFLHSEEGAVLRREPTRAPHTIPCQDRSCWAEG